MKTSYKLYNKLALAGLLAVIFSNNAHAINQGNLASSSTATGYISISKLPVAEVTKIASELVAENPDNLALVSDICIYSTTGDYNITATGDGPDNKFTLKSGDQNIAYNVNVKSPTTNAKELQTGKVAKFTSMSCDGAGRESKLNINIQQADISRDKSYTGVLTLLVSPY